MEHKTICRQPPWMLLVKAGPQTIKENNKMKTMMTLVAVFAAGMLMTTGCSSTYKTGSCTKTVSACSGSCCKDPATCAKCCTDAAGCAKCCHKS
jgi:uncharacterized protein YgiB involved in biofilm formation